MNATHAEAQARLDWEVRTLSTLTQIRDERLAQEKKWGEQNHPDGTGEDFAHKALLAREACNRAFTDGHGTWQHILAEEVFEAFAEADPVKLRAELIQVAAVAVAWAEKIDRDIAKAAANG